MGTCISRCDCSCTGSSSPVLLPPQQQQELPQPTVQDKLVILSSSPLPSTYPLADSSSSSPIKPPPPSSPSLSSTPSTNTTSNRSSGISCTSSTLSSAYASSSSASASTSTYTSSSASSELGRSFSDEFQWSNVRKHPPKPRRSIHPAPSQQQQKAPPPAVPHKKPPPSWHRVAPTNTPPCPQLQRSFRKGQRIGSSTRTASERQCVGSSVDDVGKAKCSSNNCDAKTHNRRPDGCRGGGRPNDSDKRKERKERVRQKKTESRVHHMMDVPALLDVDQIGSSHRYCPGEDKDNSLVALDCFIFL